MFHRMKMKGFFLYFFFYLQQEKLKIFTLDPSLNSIQIQCVLRWVQTNEKNVRMGVRRLKMETGMEVKNIFVTSFIFFKFPSHNFCIQCRTVYVSNAIHPLFVPLKNVISYCLRFWRVNTVCSSYTKQRPNCLSSI